MTIENDVLQTWYDSVVELFELDLTENITTGVGSNKFYFTNQTTVSGTKLQWKATGSGSALVTYEPLPIAAEGFDRSTKGQIARPTLTVANIFNTFTEALEELDDLIGAKIKRRRTLAKYLGGMPSQDLDAEFPTDVYYIERKVAETNQFVTFELASEIDLEGLQLPKRIITQNYCIWKYRGSECGYAGLPVANELDAAPVPSGALASDPLVLAYTTAATAVNNTRRALSAAEAALNVANSHQVANCSGSRGGDSEFNLGGVRRFGYSATAYSFALCSGNASNPVLIMWSGAVKNASDDDYVVSDQQYSSTLNKPMYEVERRTFGGDYGLTAIIDPLDFDVSNRGSATFAFQDENNQWVAVWSGQRVSGITTSFPPGYVGPQYRVGGQRLNANNSIGPLRYAKKLDANGSCQTALAEVSGATASLATASGQYVAALAVFSGAAAALSGSPTSLAAVSGADVCGKRVNSCRLRFPTGSLPFGGFPGSNIQR
jgi:lambda family phage minor tail protein L